MSEVQVGLALILTIPLWVLYHKMFRVIYFRNMLQSIVSELFSAFLTGLVLAYILTAILGAIISMLVRILMWALIAGGLVGLIWLLSFIVFLKKRNLNPLRKMEIPELEAEPLPEENSYWKAAQYIYRNQLMSKFILSAAVFAIAAVGIAAITSSTPSAPPNALSSAPSTSGGLVVPTVRPELEQATSETKGVGQLTSATSYYNDYFGIEIAVPSGWWIYRQTIDNISITKGVTGSLAGFDMSDSNGYAYMDIMYYANLEDSTKDDHIDFYYIIERIGGISGVKEFCDDDNDYREGENNGYTTILLGQKPFHLGGTVGIVREFEVTHEQYSTYTMMVYTIALGEGYFLSIDASFYNSNSRAMGIIEEHIANDVTKHIWSSSEQTDADTNGYFDNDYYNWYHEFYWQGSSSYAFPSDSEFVTTQFLSGLTQNQIILIRNEIYARHGYTFNTTWIREYFESHPWYYSGGFDESSLNETERENIEIILAYEKAMGWK